MDKKNKHPGPETISLFNEAKYRAILNSTVDGIITINEKGIIESFNPAAERLFGYTAGEIIGKNIAVLMPEPHRSAHNEYVERYLSTNEAKIIGVGREAQGLRKDGTVFDIYLAVSDVQAGGQRLFTGIIRDITELKQAQRSLHESEERFRRSQRFANIGTWDWNIRTGELYWSERIAGLFGYKEGELETTYDNFLNAVYPDDRQQVIDAVRNCIEHGVEYNIEHRCRWPNGEVRWLLEQGDVMRDSEGKPLNMLGVVQDISLRKQAEIGLQAAKEEAERANQAKSEFLSSMSHELRTPLNAVLGFAQLLEFEESLTAGQRENIKEIQQAGNHLLQLINEILDLSKIESGHVSLSLVPVSLVAVVRECCTLTQSIADKKGIRIRCYHNTDNCDGSTGKSKGCLAGTFEGQPFVYADYTRLKQVLLNLLSNAVKYNRNYGTVELLFYETAEGMGRIEVRDSGFGISPEKQQQLFQPFNRLGAETGNIEGTGIGLIITKRFVQMMGGKIGVESKPSIGSTFWVELPRINPEQLTHSIADQVTGSKRLSPDTDTGGDTTVSQEAHTGEKLKLLVVEDNHTNQTILENQLRVLGYTADIASNATQGFKLFVRNRYLCVLTDINLSDVDGYEFTRQIRRHEKNSAIQTPVIAVTANAVSGDAEKCLSEGMDDYISKPVDLHKLGLILRKHIPEPVQSDTMRILQNREAPEIANAVNINVLRDILGDDNAAHKKILESFNINSPHIVNDIHNAYANHLAADIAWCTHQLKSSSRSIGAAPLADCCQALEAAAREENWQNIDQAYDKLDQLFNSVVDFIRGYKPKGKENAE